MKFAPVLSSRYCPSGILLVTHAVNRSIPAIKVICNPLRIIFANLQNRLVLSSNQIKRLRSLHQKKFRDESGLFLVEGIKQVEELLKSDFKIHEIYATEAWMGGVDHVTVNSSE